MTFKKEVQQMIYGYCRVSTKKQNIERQIRNITEAYTDAIIYSESFTGTKIDRPEWNRLYKKVKPGDTIVFDEVSRMSRDAAEGFMLYKQLFESGINLVFLKESHINTDSYKESMNGVIKSDVRSGDLATDELINAIMAAVNKFMLNKVERDIYSAFEQAQKEVDYLHQRTREGIETARENGKQIGLAKGARLITKKSIPAKEIIKKHNKSFGGTLTNEETWKLAGISKMTFYKYKDELKKEILKTDEPKV